MRKYLDYLNENLRICLTGHGVTIYDNLNDEEFKKKSCNCPSGTNGFYTSYSEFLPSNLCNILCLKSDRFYIENNINKGSILLHELLHGIIDKCNLKPKINNTAFTFNCINRIQTIENSILQCLEESSVRILSEFFSQECGLNQRDIFGNEEMYSLIFYGGNSGYIMQFQEYTEHNLTIPNPVIELNKYEINFFNKIIKTECVSIINFLIKNFLNSLIKNESDKKEIRKYLQKYLKRNLRKYISKEIKRNYKLFMKRDFKENLKRNEKRNFELELQKNYIPMTITLNKF